jgi:hypothetical protein
LSTRSPPGQRWLLIIEFETVEQCKNALLRTQINWKFAGPDGPTTQRLYFRPMFEVVDDASPAFTIRQRPRGQRHVGDPKCTIIVSGHDPHTTTVEDMKEFFANVTFYSSSFDIQCIT